MKLLSFGLTTILVAGRLSGAVLPMESRASSAVPGELPVVVDRETMPNVVGPFQVFNADSSAVLQLQFVGQLRTDWESKDRERDDDRDNDLSMQARRIRPSLTLKFPQPRILFRLHLSTAPRSLELMDLYFNYGFGRNRQFRVGQYKIPFTRYRIQSFQRLTFVDWSIVTKYFGAERQMGFSIHNGYEQPPRLAYVFGVFSGVNARASHTVGLSKMYGEETVNPSDLADSGPRAEFHPELVGHFSYNPGGIQVRSDSDEERGGLRYSLGISLAWDLDPVDYRDLAFRAAPELLIKYRGASLMSAGYTGFVEIGNSLRTRQAMAGLLVQTSVRVTQRCELSFRYAVVDFERAVIDDAFARAGQLISEAEQHLVDSTLTQQEVDNLKELYCNAGRILREQEVTIGFNFYIREHSLKWQGDFGRLRYSLREGGTLDDIVARSQFQVAF
ncbi:MAG: porin [bacterium]